MHDQLEEIRGESGAMEGLYRHWGAAVAISIGCGVLFALFVGDKPPVPFPGVANPLFWIGWGPVGKWPRYFGLTFLPTLFSTA